MERIYQQALRNLLKNSFADTSMGFERDELIAKAMFVPKGFAYAKIINDIKCALVVAPSRTADPHYFVLHAAWLPVDDASVELSLPEIDVGDIVPHAAQTLAENIWDPRWEIKRGFAVSAWRFSTQSDRFNNDFTEKMSRSGRSPSETEIGLHMKKWFAMLQSEKNDLNKAVAELRPVVDDMFFYIKAYIFNFFENIHFLIGKKW